MSNAVLNLAWKADLPGTDKLVLVSLADFAREDGRAWLPLEGENGLIRRCGLTRRTVQRAILRLVGAGHLTRQERPGRGVVYTVHPRAAELAGVPPVPATSQTGAPVAPNPIKPLNQSGARIAAEPGICPTLWAAFLEMRSAMGRPITPHSAQLLSERLLALSSSGGAPEDIINQSLLNGWANLYPLKAESRRPAQRRSPRLDLSPPPAQSPCREVPMPEDRCTPAQAVEIMREVRGARSAAGQAVQR